MARNLNASVSRRQVQGHVRVRENRGKTTERVIDMRGRESDAKEHSVLRAVTVVHPTVQGNTNIHPSQGCPLRPRQHGGHLG